MQMGVISWFVGMGGESHGFLWGLFIFSLWDVLCYQPFAAFFLPCPSDLFSPLRERDFHHLPWTPAAAEDAMPCHALRCAALAGGSANAWGSSSRQGGRPARDSCVLLGQQTPQPKDAACPSVCSRTLALCL